MFHINCAEMFTSDISSSQNTMKNICMGVCERDREFKKCSS